MPPALKRIILDDLYTALKGRSSTGSSALKREENRCRTSAERPLRRARLTPCSETVRLEVTPWAASFAETRQSRQLWVLGGRAAL
jgi:hypothetical protein